MNNAQVVRQRLDKDTEAAQKLKRVVWAAPFPDERETSCSLPAFIKWLNTPKRKGGGKPIDDLMAGEDRYLSLRNQIGRYVLDLVDDVLSDELAEEIKALIEAKFGQGDEGVRKFVKWALTTDETRILHSLFVDEDGFPAVLTTLEALQFDEELAAEPAT